MLVQNTDFNLSNFIDRIIIGALQKCRPNPTAINTAIAKMTTTWSKIPRAWSAFVELVPAVWFLWYQVNITAQEKSPKQIFKPPIPDTTRSPSRLFPPNIGHPTGTRKDTTHRMCSRQITNNSFNPSRCSSQSPGFHIQDWSKSE